MVRSEIVFMALTAGVLYGMYHQWDFPNVRMVYTWGKYLMVIFLAYVGYNSFQKNPAEFIQLMRGGQGLLTKPKQTLPTSFSFSPSPSTCSLTRKGQDIVKKRSVSESRKKFVASQQQWRCKHCRSVLTHTFQVDHVIGLEMGGSNEVDNLVALCVECHAHKTSLRTL